jgi:hypothetical protein
MKNPILWLTAAGFLVLGSINVSANHHEEEEIAPTTLIHVVTVTWKADATEAQIQAALEGVKDLARAYEGITRVWVKTVSAQGERTHAFAMEFADQMALVNYADSDAQKAWYDLYLPIRERSTTFDISN